ncbi:MAG: AAA family ATPase [Gammaproteobacteria bacterium]|nr:AAA family ATPase [Gammaproteobacteria bacterium]
MLSNFAEHTVVYNEAGADNYQASNPSSAPYLGALGLYINPFSAQPDDEFYFESLALQQRFQTLFHMVENNKALLCVTCDEGGGKTSMLRRFVNSSKETWQPFEIHVGTVSNDRQILAKVAQSINAPVCRYQFTSILSRVQLLNENNRFPVLVIDDAHKLSPNVVSTLQKLKHKIIKKELKMSIVLFADQSIKTILADKLLRDLSDEWVYSIYLPRLSEKDTALYLQHRMAVAGMLIDKPFKPADVSVIYKLSKGLPRKTNEVAHRMLVCNFGDGRPVRTIQLAWLQKLKNISAENKIYFVMGVSLLVMLMLVEPMASKRIAGVESPALLSTTSLSTTSSVVHTSDAFALGGDFNANKQIYGEEQEISNLSAHKLGQQSGMLSSVNYMDKECDSKIFIDCGNKKGKIEKNISYK